MELTIFDQNVTPLGVIDAFTSFIWTRRYWNVGEFKLLAPYTEHHASLLKVYNLIGKRGDVELGEIRYVSIRKNDWGMEEIEAQGRFLSGWLDKRVVAVPLVIEENTQNILHALVDMNAVNPAKPERAIPNLLHAYRETSTNSGAISYVSEPYVSLKDAVVNAAQAAKLGFRIETDIRAKAHYFRVYKGADRTSGQSETLPCVFSPDFDNVLEQEFTHSVENVRSAGYVGGVEREGVPRLVVEVGGGEGMGRDEVFIDAADIEDKGNYAAKLSSRGEAELAHHVETLHFSSRIDPTAIPRYREDFDVGDRVTCFNRRWGVKIDSRVTEVVETYQQGKVELDVTFGVSFPTLSEKLRAK